MEFIKQTSSAEYVALLSKIFPLVAAQYITIVYCHELNAIAFEFGSIVRMRHEIYVHHVFWCYEFVQ